MPARNTRRRPSRSASRPAEQQEPAAGQRVGVDHPLQVLGGGAEGVLDGGQHHVGDGDVQPPALGRLRVALEDAFQRASRELGLTSQQAELLCAAMRPAAVGDLARALRCDRSKVSRLVDRVSTRGLVKRRTGDMDGRVSLIELTPEGEQLARRFIAALEAQTQTLRADWPDTRQQTAVELLNEIADALDAPRSMRPDHPDRALSGWRVTDSV
jgi:DNA-binding MarR family transcriptional regulator